MTPLVTADLGTRHAGVAVFDATGRPLGARDLLTNRASVVDMTTEFVIAIAELGVEDPAMYTLLCEWPVKYVARRAAHEDIDGLRAVGKTLELWGWAACRRAAPGVWKGNVPKHIHHARIAEALDPADRARIGWDQLGPDARDALGLGRWAFDPNHGGPARVFPQPRR